MTITNPTGTAGPFTPNGVTTNFPFTFLVQTAGEVRAQIDGVTVNPSLYAVVLAGEGGSINFFAAPTGTALVIQAVPQFTQTVSSDVAILPGVIARALDKARIIDIYLNTGIGSVSAAVAAETSTRAAQVDSLQGQVTTVRGFTDSLFADVVDLQAQIDAGLPEAPQVLFTHQFWNPPTGGSAPVSRLGGRALLGAAAINDGRYYPSGGPGTANGFTNLDWLSVLTVADGVGSDVNFAQVAILADSSADTISGLAVPVIALQLGAQTAGLVSGATPRALNLQVYDNPTGGANLAIWGIYGEAIRKAGALNNTYFAEIEVVNYGALVVSNPFVWNSGAVGMELGAGAGRSASGQNSPMTPLYLAANPMAWASGIDFRLGSIGANTTGGLISAIAMPYDYQLIWWKDSTTIAGRISADASNNLRLTPGASGEVRSASNLSVVDGGQLGFGPNGTSYIGGSSGGQFIRTVVNGVEQSRINANGMTVPVRTTDPGPVAGLIYFNSATGKFRGSNATTFSDLN